MFQHIGALSEELRGADIDEEFLIQLWEAIDEENRTSKEYRDFVGLLLTTSGAVNMEELERHPWFTKKVEESILWRFKYNNV